MTVVGYSEQDLKAFVEGVFKPSFRTLVTGGVALDAILFVVTTRAVTSLENTMI